MAQNDDTRLKRNRKGSWWKQRTQMERRIITFLLVSVVVIIGLIIGIAVVSHKNAKRANQSKNVCLTPGCVNSAAEILKNLDQSVDPCDDFYQFACGRFIKETEIPPDKSEVNVFSILKDLLKKQLKEMVEEPVKNNEPKPFALVKQLYNVCMNTTAIELDGLTTAKQLFKSVGGWPVLEGTDWNEVEFEWKKSMYKFRKHGLPIDGFINAAVGPNLYNSTQHIISLDQAVLDIKQEHLVKGFPDPVVSAYYSYLVDLAVYFGADRKFAEYEVRNMLNLQIEIAKICLTEEQRHDVLALTNNMNITELQKLIPGIEWLDFINGIIGRPDQNLTASDLVDVAVSKYLNSLLSLLESTSKRDQANYVFFKVAYSLVKYLPDYIRNRDQQFKATVSGAAMRAPRWSECIDVTGQSLKLAIGTLYVRNYFQEEARQNVIEIVRDIRSTFLKMLKQLDWMDETTRKLAIEKALSITIHIGYPDEFLGNKKLEDYYSELKISSSNYLRAMNEINIFKVNKAFGELKNPINKTDWTTRLGATEINAGYSLEENSIQFPAGILQGVFFNKDRPQYMNYGAIAYVVGHELTHGFDDQGKLFDKKGNLVNWWGEKTDKAFKDKAKCIVDQYSKEIVPDVGLHVNGETTQSENIADNGGIREAYIAYNTWIERNGPEPTLPGLNYTSKQMFWISAANCWCSKERREFIENHVMTDEHPPNRYRVLIPFGNTDYFAKDFNCLKGSKMNPKHKCQVW